MVNRRRRSIGRWLAPVALITCAVAVYAVVDDTLLKDDSASQGSTSTQAPAAKKTSKTAKKSRHRRAYVVKPGDTLSAISIKTGVTLDTIKRLNPKIDVETLHAGQRVRLSR
jgi:LysM repeat protein